MAKKILVMDDTSVVSRLAEGPFAEEFAECDLLVAPRAAEAFERFHVAQPDLILLNDSLPDMDGESVCYHLLNDPFMSRVPVVVMSGNGHAKVFEEKYSNVIKTLQKPVEPEALAEALASALSLTKPQPHPTTMVLFREAERISFAAHTGFFSLKNAMDMAYGDKMTGALRVFLNRYPVDLFFSRGRFVFATTRNYHLYMKDSPVILSNTNLGLIAEAEANQGFTGCPIFLYLSIRNGFPHDDVVQITREHGQRLWASLWTAGRINFEFEEMTQFPDFARNFPPSDEDPDNWVLGSLRHVKFDSLTASQRPDPNGSPSYTRKGYELVQKLKLNDVEARFATAVNGTDSLQMIARKIGVPLNDALLIVFRFLALGVIDYWSSSILPLPEPAAATA
jgi:CheY-like chemotaxis protein